MQDSITLEASQSESRREKALAPLCVGPAIIYDGAPSRVGPAIIYDGAPLRVGPAIIYDG